MTTEDARSANDPGSSEGLKATLLGYLQSARDAVLWKLDDLSDYDVMAKLAALADAVPTGVYRRLRKLVSRAPWSTGLSMLLAVDGYRDAGLFDADVDPTRVAAIVAGHNINFNYQYENRLQFEDEPDFMDSMLSLHGLDTDHAGSVSEVLRAQGPIYTIGAACAVRVRRT